MADSSRRIARSLNDFFSESLSTNDQQTLNFLTDYFCPENFGECIHAFFKIHCIMIIIIKDDELVDDNVGDAELLGNDELMSDVELPMEEESTNGKQ